MKRIIKLLCIFSLILLPAIGVAQSEIEAPVPTVLITDRDGNEEELSEGGNYEGEAPLKVSFYSNAPEYDDFSRVCTWTFTHDDEAEPFLTRYDSEVDYEFREAGLFSEIGRAHV